MEKLKRPDVLYGATYRIKTGCGNMYVIINSIDGKISEVFGVLGKTGGCAASQLNAICMMVSDALRLGHDIDDSIKRLKGQRCNNPCQEGEEKDWVWSCADAIGRALEWEKERLAAQI
jgi:ribonucleoside-diphosphate reductase alpha chain